MPQRAHVTSVEALQSFRASLMVYLGKARPALEGVSEEVRSTRVWLQNDRRIHWEGQVRRWAKVLEQVRGELFSARLSNLRETTAAQQLAVQKAQRAFEEAEAKLKLVKQWSREYVNRVEPLSKQMEKLHSILTNDLPEAAAYLAQAVETLDAYAEVARGPDGAGPSVLSSSPGDA